MRVKVWSTPAFGQHPTAPVGHPDVAHDCILGARPEALHALRRASVPCLTVWFMPDSWAALDCICGGQLIMLLGVRNVSLHVWSHCVGAVQANVHNPGTLACNSRMLSACLCLHVSVCVCVSDVSVCISVCMCLSAHVHHMYYLLE